LRRAAGSPSIAAVIHHPLNPLMNGGIRKAAPILRRDQDVTSTGASTIELRDPSKQAFRHFSPGDPIAREAEVVCRNRNDGRACKAPGLAFVQRIAPLRIEAEGRQDCDRQSQRAWKVVDDRNPALDVSPTHHDCHP
jgi:Cu2+-containing amine oxidase